MLKRSIWKVVFALAFLAGVAAVRIYWADPAELSLTPFVGPIEPRTCGIAASFPGLSREIINAKKGKSGYFIAGNFTLAYPARDDNMNDWYGKHLKAMAEPSLLDETYPEKEVYRFLWLRTFHHPIAVRVERSRNGIKLVTTELSGKGGYDPVDVLRHDEADLNEYQWCELENQMDRAAFWNLPTVRERMGYDGSEWIVEGLKDGRYHVVDRWVPEEGSYREVCLHLLELSGIDTAHYKDLY